MKSLRMVTFGCKANQYDTQLLREALGRRGMEEAGEGAELVVINTCTVTADAGRKARKLIRRIHRKNPDSKVAVTGCLAESEPEVLRSMPGVEWVLGNGEAKRPANFLRHLGFERDPEELGVPAGITEFAGHTRAFVKIQDGCDHACSFCIIPSVRGASRSRTSPELCAEVRELVQAGHAEVVLCGIHIGHWGREWGLSLGDLLADLVALDPRDDEDKPLDYRLRLSSIEATEVDETLLAVMVAHPQRVAPHLHMPLQSGSATVLQRMNRWYDPSEYVAACDRIRSSLDRPAFTADVLVGFPAETDSEFEETLALAAEVEFARLHVFPFSARPGTPAWDLAHEQGAAVPPPVVRERRAQLSEQAHTLGEDFRRSLDGARERVILEGFSGLSGRYQRVRVESRLLPDGPLPSSVDVILQARERNSGDPQTLSAVELLGIPICGSTPGK
ncbi:MAG TPA: tRNA (N(6)-L-threonylcarbamoyladenosine(37)-C(2))-methylthiotransferase MtaB [Planctomycetota bacterium]|nr:tRNA (N(6)-L-threonylcarbamoyladenosine(37)-C(2))-methylthiotransferase MtaB [Planctomycetota bacterium]